MELLIKAFNLILYQPFFNALILLYQHLPGQDFGIAVIVLTVLIRLILYPLMAQSLKSQKILSQIQPKIQELQRKYKNDKESQMKAIMEVYQKEKFNPFGGCLPLLLQLPILIALFWVFMAFKDGLTPEELSALYSFVSLSKPLSEPSFLGLINLTRPSLVLAILAGICQFFQSKMTTFSASSFSTKKGTSQMGEFSNIMQKQMLYFFPIFTLIILLRLPAVIALYWLTTSLFSIGQQYLIFKKI